MLYHKQEPLSRKNFNLFIHPLRIALAKAQLPGPFNDLLLVSEEQAQTEQFVLSELPLALNRRRKIDLSGLENIRGWSNLQYMFDDVKSNGGDMALFNKIQKELYDYAIISESHALSPLALLYQRMAKNINVAWLPNPIFTQPAWTELLCLEWAQHDHERFPNFGNWQKMPEWMTQEEEKLKSQTVALEHERQLYNRLVDQKLGELDNQINQTMLAVNQGRRRLITSQGQELVDEVANVLHEFGFEVQKMDEELAPEQTKYEDLRLTIPDDKDWEAIVEVRGYGNSGGKTDDFLRLERFARYYYKEKGRWQSKKILIINGQIELLPNQRQEPLAAAIEEVKTFGEDDGLIIWTLDLFRAWKRLPKVDSKVLRQSIVESTGRWEPPEP